MDNHSRLLCACVILMIAGAGCTSLMRGSAEKSIATDVQMPETVGEATRHQGLAAVTVESVALVTGLSGTGSDPPPTVHRQSLIDEMQKRNVENPNTILSDPSTAMVIVRAVMPPGTQKGDPLDIEVRTPSRSKTKSLGGGWLMETRLRDVAILDQELRTGHVRALAQGPVLLDTFLQDEGNRVAQLRGRILGGGVATKSRPIGLTLKTEHHSGTLSKMIGDAINQRFDTYRYGKRQGAATPKDDKFIELAIHPRYRNNLIRYFRVIEQIRLRDSLDSQLARLSTLEGELLVPATSALSALRLEAIGDEAIASLKKGLQSPSAEVRFYTAEALAYLDQPIAGKTLAASVDEPAFRSRALLALGAMSSVQAHDALTSLLNRPSAEARYGAFRALQNMNPQDPILGQRTMGGIVLHEIASTADPLVHVAKSRRPEIVVFGRAQPLQTPMMVLVDKTLLVKNESRDRLRVTRYQPGGEDRSVTCPATVTDLISALTNVEATYPEIVQTLHAAKKQECLQCRLVFDAIAKTGRTYTR